jgi:cyclase
MPLATRIIPTLLNRGGSLVKGRGFNHGRIIGHTLQAIRIYQGRGVDELIYLDVGATPAGRGPDVDLVSKFAHECFMPLTIGGGIRTLDHASQLIANGADKITVGTAAVEDPSLISAIAAKYGSQAVVVSIDVKNGTVATHCGTVGQDLEPVSWAREVERRGAGEILLNVVERDGTLTGYDLDLIGSITDAVRLPVIACGGAGTYAHMKQALDAGAHAVAASALFCFTDATPQGAARYLDQHGYPVRLQRKAA